MADDPSPAPAPAPAPVAAPAPTPTPAPGADLRYEALADKYLKAFGLHPREECKVEAKVENSVDVDRVFCCPISMDLMSLTVTTPS